MSLTHSAPEPSSTEGESALLKSMFPGTGSMSQICRETDWAATPLGPVEGWPVSLRTATAIVLGCAYPAILVWGPRRAQLYNDAYAPLIGSRHPRALGESVHDTWPEFSERQEPVFRRVYSGETVEMKEARYLLDLRGFGEPEEFFFDACFTPVPDDSGVICGSLSTLIDTTARVRARGIAADRERLLAELAIEHERLVAAQAVTNVGSWETHFPTLHVSWSAQTFRIFGLDQATFPPTHAAFLAHILPEDRAAVDAAFVASFGTRAINVIEHRIVHADGSIRRVEERWRTFVDESGGPSRAVGTCQDITERWAAEDERRMLSTALAHLADEGVAVIDENRRLMYTNAAHRRLFGYEAVDVGSLHLDCFMPDAAAREEFVGIMAQVRVGKSWNGLLRRQRMDDGRVFWIDLIFAPVPDTGSTRYICIVRDATERLAREQHLRRVERIAGMGTLLGGVAHELNNPLTAIMGFAQLLLEQPRSDADREDIETIQREAHRMTRIVANLRISAPDAAHSSERELLSVNDVVHQVLRTRAYALSTRSIAVCTDLAEDVPLLHVDRAQVEQMLLNLVINAEQAMASGASGAPVLTLRTARTATGCRLSVADNGSGIPSDQLARIFDPFFTTKAPGEGTGLGLSVVHTIVTEHHGEIRVESEIGKGTVFDIDFPRAPVAASPPQRLPESTAPQLRVLVVDDEDGVRRVAVRLLERRGHLVDEARDGGSALTLLAAASVPYDAIVSDLRMPGLSGVEFIRRLAGLGGAMEKRVIFLTGDDSSPDVARMVAEFRVPVLTKPAGLASLVDGVERLSREVDQA